MPTWNLELALLQNMKEQLLKRISEQTSRNSVIQSDMTTTESYVQSLEERISIVEDNYASGEQSRIANELSRINSKKSETEKMFTVIMNEYRDKSSQLTTFQTQGQ